MMIPQEKAAAVPGNIKKKRVGKMNILLDLAPLPQEVEILEKASGAAVIIIVLAVVILALTAVCAAIRKKRK